jgi:hypothetical protein
MYIIGPNSILRLILLRHAIYNDPIKSKADLVIIDVLSDELIKNSFGFAVMWVFVDFLCRQRKFVYSFLVPSNNC